MKKGMLFVLLFTAYTLVEAKPKLIDFAYNVYSQFGEDGIIEKIFEIIGAESKIAVEFGASNGLSLSNTANLFINQGWKSVLIECRDDLYSQMVANVAAYNCVPIKRMVHYQGADSIESILKEKEITDSIDLMSIDIDGNDYYIFAHLTIRPRVVIIEHNPTIPATLDIYQPYGSDCLGCSIGALVRLASQKGYNLVAITDTNSFFVRDEEFYKFDQYETDLLKIRDRVDKYLRYIITNYGGEYKIIGQKVFDPSYQLTYPLRTVAQGEFTAINRLLS